MRVLIVVALLAAPSPSPAPAPRAVEEALPESYKRVLTALRERKEEPRLTEPLRFGRPERAAPAAAASAAPRPPVTILVRAVKQIEGEWAAFLDEERRPSYTGDTARGWKIVAIDETGVTFDTGGERRKIAPRPVRPPFPTLTFNGMVDMPGGRVVLMKGRRDPVKLGEVVDGARIVDIQPQHVVVDHHGERRTIPIR